MRLVGHCWLLLYARDRGRCRVGVPSKLEFDLLLSLSFFCICIVYKFNVILDLVD